MKSVVEYQREFFAYFNALETRGVWFHPVDMSWKIRISSLKGHKLCNSLPVSKMENLGSSVLHLFESTSKSRKQAKFESPNFPMCISTLCQMWKLRLCSTSCFWDFADMQSFQRFSWTAILLGLGFVQFFSAVGPQPVWQYRLWSFQIRQIFA